MSTAPRDDPTDGGTAAVARRSWRVRPTLPGGDYHLADVWALERERIFAASWVCVGRQEEVSASGSYVVRDVAGESILIVGSLEGRARAFFNACPHRGTRLLGGSGTLESGRIVCRHDGWAFDADGALVAAPNVGRDTPGAAGRALWSVELGAWEGFLFANLDRDAEPLQGYLERNPEGDPTPHVAPWRMAELRIAHRIDYDVAANWKILVENYSECLHCPTVHPELVRLVPLFRKGMVEEGDGAQLVAGATTLTATGTSNRPPLPGLEGRDRHVYLGNHIHPTMMINLHTDCVMTYRLEPSGPRHTRVVSEYLFHPDTIARSDFDPSDIVAFWDIVSRQDWAVCEREQLGVSSRAYARGGVYPYNDRSLVDFNERYRADIDVGASALRPLR
jgi:glycine betaine catabolism A